MDFKLVEDKWGKYWEDNQELYKAEDNSKKEKKYVLVEFPYPSGSGLHIGHAFSFTGGDIYARFKRMQGYNVLFPMGWDAFGLPTENYAIKMKKKPQEITKENTDMFRKQMKKLAFSFDWGREVNTTDPDYYKWTQWIFIQLFRKGLAYKKEMPINWCPSCKIGLANEEVVDGKCERCGAEVSRRKISQWVVKITDYADKLIKGLDKTDFIEKVKQAQVNWIGKSDGAKIRFKVEELGEEIEVFTTRPDTLFGATFMVIAPEAEIVERIMKKVGEKKRGEIKNYIKEARGKSDLERTELNKEKTGVFSGLMAVNPVNNKEIPIWISDFVLASYGTGAIMAVPAHDERDYAFAKKFKLDIIPVIQPEKEHNFDERAYTDVNEGKIINSVPINGLVPEKAFEKMINWLEDKKIGERTASYHLRDWIFSRQHYWGEPIPMIYCQKCGWVPVEDKDLPIVLPEVEAYEPSDDGKSPLSKMSGWVKVKCPKCGGEAERETDTMPNWAGSDWYFLRYIDPDNDSELANKELMKYWGPVDIYIGGDEHNVLHLLYSRFIYKFLWDIKAVPEKIPEPYYKRISHGVILGPDNQRMSKSRGNVIVPEKVSKEYGVDVVRMYLMFMGPFDSTMAWNDKTVIGIKRFLEKWEKFVYSQIDNKFASNDKVKVIINKMIKGVGEDLENFRYNTAIAKMMEGTNELVSKKYKVGKDELKKMIQILAPLAPYSTEEMWSKLGEEAKSVHVSEWPKVEDKYLKENEVNVAIAINGKVRDQITIKSDQIDKKEEVLELAKTSEKIKNWVGDNKIVKEIYIAGKMVNLAVKVD